MVSISHELGHAVILRRLGIPITKFELERGEDFFGGVGFSPGVVPRDRQVVAADCFSWSSDTDVFATISLMGKEKSSTPRRRSLSTQPAMPNS
jgi:hypothetical protein